MVNIKFEIGDEVYLYDSSAVVKTSIKGIDIKPNKITYNIEGYYNSQPEENLFKSFEELVEDLKNKIIPPRSLTKNISEKAKKILGK